MTLLFFIYIPVMKAALTPFDCYEAVANEGKVMESNPRLKCTLDPQTRDEADYIEIAIMAFTVIVGLGIGFPLLYINTLYRARKEGTLYSEAIRRVGDSHVHFARDQWYWNFVLFLKKFAIAFLM